MMFWSVVAALTAGAVLALVWPLARRPQDDDRLARDLAVYRDQLRELDAEVERGTIRAEERDAAKTEIERRMLRAADAGNAPKGKDGIKPGIFALVVAIVLPLIAVPLYLRLGAPDLGDQPLAGREDARAHHATTSQFKGMASRLAQRLRDNPDDVDGWRLLGRTYGFLEQYADSAEAYRRAVQLDPSDAGTLASLGEALIEENNGEITPEAISAFDRALLADPTEPASRYYRALAYAQSGDFKNAYDGWLALAKDTPADAPWRESLMRALQGVSSRLGIDLASVLPPPPSAAPHALGGPTSGQIQAAGEMSPEDRHAFIRSMVDRLAERLRETPDDLQGWMRLGQAYAVLERKEDALSAFDKALALAPQNSLEIYEIRQRIQMLMEK